MNVFNLFDCVLPKGFQSDHVSCGNVSETTLTQYFIPSFALLHHLG